MVFSGHPKYHNRADVVFGKEYLRNGDLLEAFAHCLPDFITKYSSEECRNFMEKVVGEDHLWTSLQVNLWDAQRSDSPTPDKLRVFEDCCAVIDLAFSVLEDSREVDWRAPEFGSLAQNFESFITHCFQDAFMGRFTSFRVGIIKARFCKALLAQFSNDIKKEGTVSFRSQWDVASLARVICTLGLRDKDDPEFWNSYVNGGHIGTEFTARALEMIKMTECDGPLLIFCLLGRLAASAIPLDQSGVEPEDIKEVWELQGKVIDKERLRLYPPSDAVWGELDQLRKQVNDLCGNNTGDDRGMLQELLRMIDDVCNHRFSNTEGPSQSNPTEKQGPKTSVNSTLSSGELRAISDRLCFVPESTTVTGRPSTGSRTSEGEIGSGQHSVDNVLDGEMKTYIRPESPQNYESGFHNHPSPHPIVQGIPGVGIIRESVDASPSAIYLPFMGDARPRPSKKRTDSEFSATKQSLVAPLTIWIIQWILQPQ
jgi:hypothetical protein